MDGSKPRRNAWSPEMGSLAQVLWNQGVSASEIAKRMNSEFGATLTRSSVLGHLHRGRNKVPGAGKLPGAMTKKSNWRKDDELWTNALFMRKMGHDWKPIALTIKLSITSLKARLRVIAKEDMAEDGTPAEEWAHVLE